MNHPKISIVTPSYNQGHFLEETIDSILSQNYPNLEYIIIDGVSNDGSQEIIKKYENHLKYWCSEPDNGQYDAINKGFNQATGEIFAWLNSDDKYFPWTFKTVAKIISKIPEVEWLTTSNPGSFDCCGDCLEFKNLPGFSREAFLDGKYIPFRKMSFGYIQQESTFFRRSLWEKAGKHISTEFKLAGDFDLWARFYQHADLFCVICPLGGFRLQSAQKSRQREQYISEVEISLNRMRENSNWKPNFLKRILYGTRFYDFPKIRDIGRSFHVYQGKRIIKDDLAFPNSHWAISDHHFP